MAYTQADLDALDAKIAAAGAVQQAAHSDQSVTYRSVEDLKALRALMKAEIDAAAGQSGSRLAAFSKGV